MDVCLNAVLLCFVQLAMLTGVAASLVPSL